jgi:hypothetical protein
MLKLVRDRGPDCQSPSGAVRLAVALVLYVSWAQVAAGQSSVRPVPRVHLPADQHSQLTAAAYRVGPPVQSAAHPGGVWAADAAVPRTGAMGDDAGKPAFEHLDVGFRGRLFGRAALESGGELGVQRGNWYATLSRELDPRRMLALNFESEASFYDWGGDTQVVPGSIQPFNDLYRTRLAATLYSHWAGRSSLFTGFEVALGGEDQAHLSQSVTLGGVMGIAYQAAPELRLAIGLAGSSRLEDDVWLIPFLGIDWQFARDWNLLVEGERVALDWQISPEFAWGAYAVYEQRQYRLNSGGPLPNGVLRDEQIDLGTTFAWRPRRGVELRLGGGWSAWRELSVFERQGGKLGEVEIDPAPYLELGLSLRF